ncbi:hypothetical protein DSO57_1011554 [Entomophthora muscae]|uniref:Uncharacterized protein n=1 Tax=Entomophthora muscae TaxID=34485 RepID=A0ACC2U4S9_9FUNG|nr:hypothetical protein DSO57_1011554 [Entomophthora muscae]
MPSLPAGNITYQDTRSAILRKFGSTVCMIEHKDLFSNIEFKTNETLSEFADQFYHKAQVLLGASVMVEHNTKLAMKNAVKPYQELYWALNLFLGQEFTMVQMLDYLCHLEATHNAPNKEKPRYNCPANTSTLAAGSTKTRQTQERQIPLTDITCYHCQNKGHYATKCPNETEGTCGLRPCQGAGKRPSSVEEGYSTELEINIPPDKLVMLVSLPVLCNNVEMAAPANPSPPCLEKTEMITTELFVKDEPINPLHQVVSNDVCAVLTQSQRAALEEEGDTIVAQPYSQQIMEMNSGEPLQSEDTPCLENVSIALPFKEMASHYPSVIDSLMQFVEASNNPLIHLVNKNSTYSDCTYCNILVNKVKVQAIIDSSALVNIVSTTLVKQLKIAPNVDYCKQYGNAGLVPTVSQGMYSALPLQFGSLAVSLLQLYFLTRILTSS